MRTTKGNAGTDPAEYIRQRHARLIRSERESQGMSRRALADGIRSYGIPVTVDAVSQWENAVASPRWLMSLAIARVLGVKWSSIFSLDDVPL